MPANCDADAGPIERDGEPVPGDPRPDGCTAASAPVRPATGRPNGTGKVRRLRTLHDLDRRTKAAQAAFALRDAIAADLGGRDRLTAMQIELIDNIAVMGAMLKDAAASYLSGHPIDIAEYVTLANAQRRLLADIGLERRSRDITPTLREYLRSRESAE